ncbi:MAG: DnaJ domain-containing protein [Oscillospiraceae bacterium]|jgi:curved DNA-binding protein CbpA|nr:DnaJ domain-containing protein [Oscillospiraceae bacterium]
MKENYYEWFGVEKTADAQQIKRAYYTLVKKYPPERFPEEYKRLRAAYDILSNERKRAAYDQNRSLPKLAAYLFEQAENLERLGRHAQAADVYEQTLKLHPELTQAQAALARAFERQGKIGKAISTWEKLCKKEPRNAEYAYKLALDYDHRGWNKKAHAQYRQALELDGGNAEYWGALLNFHQNSPDRAEAQLVCERGLRAMEERGIESIRLYAHAAVFHAQSDMEAAERYLDKIVRVMRAGGGQHEDPAQTVCFLLESAREMHKPAFVKYIQEMAAMLPHIDADLQEQLAEANRVVEIESLMEHGFPSLFHDLFATLNNDCDCEQCKLNLVAMEAHILAEKNAYRSKLLRLRKEYPHLYALHADFFNQVLHTRDTQKLLYWRMKILTKEGWDLAEFDDNEESGPPTPTQTVRRTGPKIGRNDPCPCGSGKKYKKCCGQ